MRYLFFILLLSNSLFAQQQMLLSVAPTEAPPAEPTYPGDVSSGLVVWLDANDYDGDGNSGNNTTGNKTTWVNKVSANPDFTSSAGGGSPLTLNVLNGQAAFELNGASGFTADAALSDLDNNDTYSYFVVFRRLNGFVSMYLTESDYSNISTAFHSYFNVFGNNWYSVARNSSNSAISVSGPANPSLAHYTTTILRANDELEVFVDGASIGSVSGATMSPGTHTALSVGRRTTSTNYFGGQLFEYILFNRELSVQERQDVESYLATKYNL